MQEKAILEFNNEEYEFDIIKGTENEFAVDISQLRSKTGLVSFDPGFVNTGSTTSRISFVNGEEGILRYRGYPVEELAEKSNFLEVAHLLMYGSLPSMEELGDFSTLIEEHAGLHTSLELHYNGFPASSPPMAILSTMLNAVACYHPDLLHIDYDSPGFHDAAAKILSKVRTIAAYTYRATNGLPFNYPDSQLDYCSNLLHMMFSSQFVRYQAHPAFVKALDKFLIVHADNEQGCSTSTVRMVGSSRANLFSSVSSGVCALWGPLHGSANVAVINMLEDIHKTGKDPSHYINTAKDKNNDARINGFGHRIYKKFDPRAAILKDQVHEIFDHTECHDPLLEIAIELEERVLKDEYFIERKLYPNLDFYSGILLRAIGIPTEMYPVMFAIGRMPGWISNWKELLEQKQRISRPRQIYNGEIKRKYTN
ncbi:MAG: citrate synthase [bacterium]|nr:citrate synthase [bacterium]